MLVIRDTSVVPPEDWSYYVVPTNFIVKTKNYTQLYRTITQHCLANGVNPPSEQTVIDYLCENLTIPCYDSKDGGPLVNRWTLGLPFIRQGGCCG